MRNPFALSRREFLAGAVLLGGGNVLPKPSSAYGVLLLSPIACGRLWGIQGNTAALAAAGLSVLKLVSDDQINYLGQPLYMVVAAQKEAAEEAAARLSLAFESRPAVRSTAAALPDAHVPLASAASIALEPAAFSHKRGDFAAALAEVEMGLFLKQTYHSATGFAPSVQKPSPELLHNVEALETFAQKALHRPVKLSFSSEQAELLIGRRAETIQTLTIGARRNGELRALSHSTLNETAMLADFAEPCGVISRHLYHCDSVAIAHQVVAKNIAAPAALPAGGLLLGLFALESAMDELAVLLKLDALRLRLLNHAELDEATGQPWQNKRLRECYRLGMERVGWDGPRGRAILPRRNRDGEFWVGYGMASIMSFSQNTGDGKTRAAFGAHFVRVLVDVKSQGLRIDRQAAVFDVGMLRDVQSASLRARAGIIDGLAAALALPPQQLASAELEVLFVDSDVAAAPIPLEPLSLYDLAMAGAAPALANAMHNACGFRPRELPFREVAMLA